MITKLASITAHTAEVEAPADRIIRSSGFTDNPATPVDDVFGGGEEKGVKRDDRLAIIEELNPGPYEYKPPFDDPNFQHYEPHSSIRLSCVNPLEIVCTN